MKGATDLIRSALEGIDREFPPEAAALLEKYISELLLWNRKVGLVRLEGKDGAEELIVRHLYDSLAPLPILAEKGVLPPEGGALADIGSGGGFPGMPLAAALPGLSVSLVERSGKKAAFLQNAAALLGIAGRVEVLDTDAGFLDARWDLAVCRAFMPLPEALPMLLGRVKTGGFAVVYAGRAELIDQQLEEHEELKRLNPEVVPVPGVGTFYSGERHLVIAERRRQINGRSPSSSS